MVFFPVAYCFSLPGLWLLAGAGFYKINTFMVLSAFRYKYVLFLLIS